MVIISTSAMEVSIQAVSPELGVHFSSTAFFGRGRWRRLAAASVRRGPPPPRVRLARLPAQRPERASGRRRC